MFYVHQRLRVLPDEIASPEAFSGLPPKLRLKVRDAFCQHIDLIEPFAEENSFHLPADELDIVRSWRHLVHGKFYLFRQLQKYMVFLATDSDAFEHLGYCVCDSDALETDYEKVVLYVDKVAGAPTQRSGGPPSSSRR